MSDFFNSENVSVKRVEPDVSSSSNSDMSDKKDSVKSNKGKKNADGGEKSKSDNSSSDSNDNEKKGENDNNTSLTETSDENSELTDKKSDNDKKDKKSSNNKLAKKAGKKVATAAGKWLFNKALFLMLKQLLLNMIGAFLQFVGGILSAIWQGVLAVAHAIVTGLCTVLGVSATVGVVILFGGLGCVITGGISLISTIFEDDTTARDAPIIEEDECKAAEEDAVAAPEETVIDSTAATFENAKKIYSILKTYMAGDEKADNKIAAVLGNWTAESGIDPTSVEGFYGSQSLKFRVSDEYGVNSFQKNVWSKKKATSNYDNLDKYTKAYMDWYGRDQLYDEGYAVTLDSGKKVEFCGIGLGQFTGENCYKLLKLAKKANLPWYDLRIQLAYSLSKKEGASYRTGYFEKWAKDDSTGDIATLTSDFLSDWEGGDPTATYTHFEKRKSSALSWYKRINKGELKVDKTLAQSVLSLANTTAVKGDAKDVQEANSKCGGKKKYDTFSGVISSDIMGEGTGADAGGNVYMSQCSFSAHSSGHKATTTHFPTLISKILTECIGADGNIKPEKISGDYGKVSLFDGGYDYWAGQCVKWSATRICSYVSAKYHRVVTISRFGDGGDPYLDGDCLGAPPLDKPIANSVFSCYETPPGHTGYVEFVCSNGGLITSELNGQGDETFHIYYVPPERCKDWRFYSVDVIYQKNQSKGNIWERWHFD